MTKALITRLLRLLRGARAPDANIPAPASVAPRSFETAPAVVPPVQDGHHPFEGDPDRRFTALVLAVGALRRGEAEPAERRVIRQIEELLEDGRDSNLVPRLPVELPRLMGLVRRDDVAPRELADRLSRDPALVGEVVRLANSPRFRPSREIANLQEAVIALGQRGLIQVVTNAIMRPIFDAQQGRFSRSAGTRLWDLTERCSFACADLCGDATDRFQAYLAGTVANVGFIAALRVLDLGYQQQQPPDTEGFHDALRDVVARLSGKIARQWGFHPNVCQAVGERATLEPAKTGDDLTRVLRDADRISKWHVLTPGLAGAALAGLAESERRCYIGIERAFGG